MERGILLDAIARNDISVIREMIKSGYDVTNEYGALTVAVKYSCVDICEFLLQNGCIPPDRTRCPALDDAVVRNDEKMVTLFLKYGFPIHGLNAKGETLAMTAARCNSPGLIDYLGEQGVDLDEYSGGRNGASRKTPVHFALRFTTEALKALIRNGVSLDTPVRWGTGIPPLTYAFLSIPPFGCSATELHGLLERVDILLNSGYSLDLETGLTPALSSREQRKLIKAKLTEHTHRTRSLQHMCRLRIREVLGQNIVVKVRTLPIPASIQSYVLLQDIVGDRVHSFQCIL